jgi:predicted MPP superfamily phosphohydrolase
VNASKAPLRWTYGLIEDGGRQLYVTSGLGTSGIPMRIGSPPEIVLLSINGS